jgi:hypothetical protein
MDVSIIIVNWNTGNLLRQCLDSIVNGFSNNENYEVLVVDNNSRDQSIAIAEGSTQKMQFFLMKKNLGFAKANNVGIRQSSGDYVILLNPDTKVLEGSFTSMIKFLSTHPQAAAVGPKLLNADLTIQPSCRRFPKLIVLALMFLKIHRFFPKIKVYADYLMQDFNYTNDQVVDQIMGACMVIPKKAFGEIGLLDEKYWIWFEEVDWCKRAANKGMTIWFSPSGEIIHHGGVSFNASFVPVRKEWRFMSSALRYTRKHLRFDAFCLLLVFVPFGLIIDGFSFFMWFKNKQHAS